METLNIKNDLEVFQDKWAGSLTEDEAGMLEDLITNIGCRAQSEIEDAIFDGTFVPPRSDYEEHNTYNKTISGVK